MPYELIKLTFTCSYSLLQMW